MRHHTTPHNKGTRRSEAESDFAETLVMADPTLAGYVARNEALRERVTKLERALEEIASAAERVPDWRHMVHVAREALDD
jgi:hypothetical protein